MLLVGLLASVVVGMIPAALYAGFVLWLDQHEKEPWWLLLLAFLWGAVPAVIMALIAQLLLDIPTTWVLADAGLAYEVVGSSIWAPITEEIAKGLGVLLVMVVARREIDSVLDGIIYGALAGLGFAFTENVLYFVGAFAEEGWGSWALIVLLRTIPFGLNHALFTGLIGAGVAAAYLARKQWLRLAAVPTGLLAGMLFHSIHNLGSSLSGESCTPICLSFLFDWAGILLLGVAVVLVWRQEKSWIAGQLPGEVSEELYHLFTSWRVWQKARWSALLSADLARWRWLRHVRQAATELAFNMHKLAVRGADPRAEQEVARYRQRLAELINTGG